MEGVGKVSKKKSASKKVIEQEQPAQEETYQPAEEAVVAESIEAAPVEKKKKKKGTKRSTEQANEPALEAQPEESAEAPMTEEVAAPETDKKKKSSKKSNNENGTASNGKLESPVIPTVTQEQIDEFREKNSISTTSTEYVPIFDFETLFPSVSSEMADYIKQFKFQKPSFIQSEVWGYLFKGENLRKDVVAIAETGSGKTLGFLIPTLSALLQAREGTNTNELKKKKGVFVKPKILVLSPTRELAQQTFDTAKIADKYLNVHSVCVYGGAPKEPQVSALRGGAEVVIATPGRLLDLHNEGNCPLDMVQTLVLDEADRMLDMGFERDIRAIIAELPKERQTLMFSATWPQEIQALAKQFQKSPMKITIGTDDLSANHSITQIVEVLDQSQKDRRLEDLLKQYHKSRTNKVLIFALYKNECVRVENLLSRKGYKVTSLHGDKPQAARNQAMEEFKSGKIPLLVATDVAARGLHVTDIEYVINYTFPLKIEDYVHRIGRTGRAGQKGVAHTFFTSFEKTHAISLVNILREAKQVVPEELTKFMSTGSKKKEHKMYGAHYKADMPIDAAPTKIKFSVDDDE